MTIKANIKKNIKEKIKNLSLISTLHYSKLILRSGLFLWAFGIYLYDRLVGITRPLIHLDLPSVVLVMIWWAFIVEMILRFFPSKLESMGCQKQFKQNYIPSAQSKVFALNPGELKHSSLVVAGFWILLNGIIFGLFFAGIMDEGMLLLIALAYSVCDMICILFFCPFQEWIMKNKCCGSCRIYNWDYAMMFTPLILVNNFYAKSLFFFALFLLVAWEIYLHKYPERFYENTNEALSCQNCNEKLCSHKKSLKSFLKKRNEDIKRLMGNVRK